MSAEVNPIDTDIDVDENFDRTYTSTYEVIVDALLDPISIAATIGIPVWGDSYVWNGAIDLWAFCTSVKAKFRSTKETVRIWTVTVVHTTKASERKDAPEDPLDMLPKISGSFVARQRPVEKDRDGNPILNAVDEPFIPAIMADDSRDTVIIEVNTEDIDLDLRAEYRDSVNDATIWDQDASHVKLTRWDWEVKYLGEDDFYIQNKFEFHIDFEGWSTEVLQQGTREFVGLDGDGNKMFRPFRGSDDELLKHPRMLKADGTPLGNADDPVFAEIEVEIEMDFSALPVPDPLF